MIRQNVLRVLSDVFEIVHLLAYLPSPLPAAHVCNVR